MNKKQAISFDGLLFCMSIYYSSIQYGKCLLYQLAHTYELQNNHVALGSDSQAKFLYDSCHNKITQLRILVPGYHLELLSKSLHEETIDTFNDFFEIRIKIRLSSLGSRS